MPNIKSKPWMDEFKEKKFFSLDNFEVESAVEIRECADFNYGERFRGEIIREKGWVVGFEEERFLDNEERIIRRYLDFLKASKEDELIAIPSKSVTFERTGIHDVMEYFSPPLVAKIGPNFEEFLSIRSGLIQILRGRFFLFPKSHESMMLVRNGEFLMLAGPIYFVEEVMEKSLGDSWDSVKNNKISDPFLIGPLRMAMEAYGVG